MVTDNTKTAVKMVLSLELNEDEEQIVLFRMMNRVLYNDYMKPFSSFHLLYIWIYNDMAGEWTLVQQVYMVVRAVKIQLRMMTLWNWKTHRTQIIGVTRCVRKLHFLNEVTILRNLINQTMIAKRTSKKHLRISKNLLSENTFFNPISSFDSSVHKPQSVSLSPRDVTFNGIIKHSRKPISLTHRVYHFNNWHT